MESVGFEPPKPLRIQKDNSSRKWLQPDRNNRAALVIVFDVHGTLPALMCVVREVSVPALAV